MEVESHVIRDVAGLAALASAWRALPATGLTQTYAWARACAEVFVPPGRLCVVTVTRGRDVVGIAPLRWSPSPVPRLELLGTRELYEPTDFVYADDDGARRLAAAVSRLGVPLHLARMPIDSPAAAAVRTCARRRGVVVPQDGSAAPWIPLDETWSAPERQISTVLRGNARRRRRIAESLGGVAFDALAPEPADLPPLLAEVFRVEAAGWKAGAGTALALDRGRRAFFERYAALASAEGRFRVYLLRVGGRAVAMQLGVEWDARLWSLKIGYDETFARCSPGTLLMLEVLGHTARAGLRSYEFMGRSEAWTGAWTRRARPCVTLRTYPANSGGAGALACDALALGRLGLGAARRAGAAWLAALTRRGDAVAVRPRP